MEKLFVPLHIFINEDKIQTVKNLNNIVVLLVLCVLSLADGTGYAF